MIDRTFSAYLDGAGTIQKAIDALQETGLILNDDVLIDLSTGGRQLGQSANNLINDEVAKFQVSSMQKIIRDQLPPLLEEIDISVSQVHGALHYSDHTSFSTTLDINNFLVSDLKVCLIDGLMDAITDRFTQYASESDSEIIELLETAKDSIDKLNAALRKRGDYLTAFGDRLYPYGGSILSIQDGEVQIHYKALEVLDKKRVG